MLAGRSLIEPEDFTIEEFEDLFSLAENIEKSKTYLRNSCSGKILASLFFEPSTRTRLSFEAAMQRLGGSCIGFAEPSSSSLSKGESLADTVKVVSSYSDAIVMRHPKEGSALLASRYSSVPIINAGDGGHHHPTQTLTDLTTIKRILGGFSGLTIGFCGDLKFGRTVHSLTKALGRYQNIHFIFISPKELAVPDYIKTILSQKKAPYTETAKIDEVMEKLDVLYMTRVQRERFLNEDEYVRLKDSYILTAEKLKPAKKNMIVLHPLPRVNEIDIEVDNNKHAVYFKQAEYGMYIRMALLSSILGVL
ncbi:MAG: aspartate carbamoyltransferase [Spirochaetaceae bacterium]|jgi:aspartate carbamoyltransferase catalytic subunit|nr:aspartate carbamoyltransferase [Spirochaetaceae bacterium]